MSTTLSGDLHNLDYGDTFEIFREARAYKYELSASGGGTVACKIESYQSPLLGEVGGAGIWSTIENKSKVPSGTTLNGSFTVPKTQLDSSSSTTNTKIRVTFSREFASTGVDYKLYFYSA